MGDIPLIKSELVQRMAARNPHLYQRDVENIVDAILDTEIHIARTREEMLCRRGADCHSPACNSLAADLLQQVARVLLSAPFARDEAHE